MFLILGVLLLIDAISCDAGAALISGLLLIWIFCHDALNLGHSQATFRIGIFIALSGIN
jgi:hypothetical protein